MDISFKSKTNQYRLTYDGDEYLLYKREIGPNSFFVQDVFYKFESVLDWALQLELEDSDAHSFAEVYALLEDVKEMISTVASKINETQFKAHSA